MEPEELLSHTAFLTALARRLVADEHLAADLAQDTWVAALEHPPSSNDHLKAWLAKVTRNFFRIHQRGESRRRRREYVYAPEEGIPSTEEIVAQEELRRKVVEAVLSLEEPYRSTIVLRYYKDLPHMEVARRLGVPLETMRTRLKKGMALLKARLDGVHGGSRKKWLAAMAPIAGLTAADAVAGSTTVLAGAAVMSAKMKLGIASVFVVAVSLITYMVIQVAGMEERILETDAPVVEGKPEQSAEPLTVREEEATADREPLLLDRLKQLGYVEESSVALTIAGRTLDRDGFPMRNVQVILQSSPDEPLALSGPDGRFTSELSLEADARKRHETILVRKSGYLTRQFECVLNPSKAGIHLGDILLEQGATISGTVLDANGRTVAGAGIGFSTYKAQGAAMEALRRRRGQGVEEVQQADGTGFFRLEEVPEGWICVWARSADSLYTPSQPVEVHAGDEINGIEIKLKPMAKDDFIAGQVLDPDGLPLPGAEIQFIVNEEERSSYSYTEDADEKGRFMARLISKVAHSLEARDREGRYDMAHVEDVEPGTHDLVLQLNRFTKDVELYVTASGPRHFEAYEAWVCSSLDGRMLSKKSVKVESLPEGGGAGIPVPDSPFFLSIRAQGFDMAESKIYDPETLPKRIDMHLQSLPGVQGRVLAAGIPAEGVKVGLYRQMEGELLINDFLCRSMLYSVVETVSIKRGYFDLGLADSGTFYLRCDHEGYAPTEVGPLELDKDVGKKGLEIELLRGGVIEGEVRMPPGRDRAGIVVVISRGDGKLSSFRTGPDGRFFFEGLPPGPWQVEQREQMIMPETQHTSFSGTRTRPPVEWDCWVEEGKITRFDLDLAGIDGCLLEGRLTLNGTAPRGWTSELTQDPDKVGWVVFGQDDLQLDGSFSQQTKIPGEYHLTLAGSLEGESVIVIRDRVILIPGWNTWSHDLSLGSLEATGRLMEGRVYFKWMGPGDFHAYVPLPLTVGKSTVKVSAPTGRGMIVHRRGVDNETVLRDVEVTEKTTTIDLGTIGR